MGLLFSVHPLEVDQIIQFLLGTSIFAIPFKTITIVLGAFLVFTGFYINTFCTIFKKHIAINLFFLALFTIIFLNSGLIWGFGIYFILWHSVPSIYDQVMYLYGSSSKKSWLAYFKSGFIFWLIPSLSIFALYFFVNNDITFKALFFALIAAVTFPHAYVISKMQTASNS
jgi:Brp/Blh family beta-carotene 15,15'-monooxygenase